MIVGGALALAACSSMNTDAFKPSPLMDTVSFESDPPGAEAKTSNGQTCRTPCSLALPISAPLTVVFTLNGYEPESETLEPISAVGSPTQLRPNPVIVELTPASPQSKSAKKPPAKKKPAAGAKPAAKPTAKTSARKPAASTAAAPATTAAPAQQPAPWPATPPAQR